MVSLSNTPIHNVQISESHIHLNYPVHEHFHHVTAKEQRYFVKNIKFLDSEFNIIVLVSQ